MVSVAVIIVTVVRAVGNGDIANGNGGDGLEIASEIQTEGVLFRDTAQQRSFGRLAVTDGGGTAPRQIADLKCSRVAFAGGRGVCLTIKRNVISNYSALVFNERFEVERTVQLAGIPSRTRVSPGGRIAATTVFVFGHSYADGAFSTRTSFIDLDSGEIIDNMERFTVLNHGESFAAVDFNFWGVTFVDDERFFATLGTGGKTFLVDGDVTTRTANVLREGVECPSLSPDGRRIAFKKQVSAGIGPLRWRLSVLELATGREYELAETRSVDDQVSWLDDERILYSLTADGEPTPSTDDGQSTVSTNVWVAAADGGGRPEIYLENASSPVVVRDPI